ncbi:MAG: hypothetical protein IKY44_01365, partial [Clostridia bacterium]|nr:hypothetical protein [Clostridia bacterium]
MKRWVSCIVSLLLIASVFAPISSLFVSASATVVPQGYTAIYTAKDLSNIKLNLKGKYILMNDIDLSSWGKWTPIGIDSYFSGVFDGNGFYIHNMQIDDGTIYRDAGLFSSLNGATVKNVKIKGSINCNSTPVLNAGAVAGSVYDSTISRCASYVTISYKNGTPTGDSCTSAHGAQLCAGGIAGSVWGNTKIEECFNANKITGISSVAPLSIGGIVGEINDYSKIKNCYNIADVSANTDHVSVQVGGITGGQFWADACEISYCYNTGKVSGVCGEWKYDRKYVGGISGELSNNTDSNTVKKCYYESSAPAAVGMVRIAINEGYSVDITVEAKACSYSNMQKKSTYSGFDFANIWEMNSEKSPYPTLKNLIDNEKESDDEQDVPGSNDKEQPDESNSTVDKEILCLKSSFPANGEQLSSLNSITLTFNQNISVSPDWSVGSICIKSYETDEVVFEIDDREFYSRNSVVSGNKTTIPLDGGGLVPGKYYIEVPSGLFVAQGLNSAGKIIKFNGVLGKDDLCFIVESDTCRLTELNSVDYLAFSDVAYNKELYVDMTIKEIFSSVWDSNWKDTNIKYREIFGHIANWRVRNMTSKHNGFAAVAFVNDYNEVVIAFRGSEDPMYMISTLKKYAYADFGSLNSDEKDAVNDWLKNDIPMQIFNKVGDQFFDAIEFYDNIAKKDWIVGVHVTGHSLGGAWADVVSSYSGCYGESFNAVSALDVVYKSYPEYMASKYFGVDKQSFVDHVNEYDVLAGQFGADLKTRRVHSTNFSSVSIAKNHSLESMVTRDLNGNVVLTEYHEIIPDQLSWICVNYYEIIKGFVLNGFSIDAVNGACVDFGTSGNDSFYNILGASNAADFAAEALSSIFSRVSYGGDGNDEIVTGIWFDIIVGGRGNDILSGSLSGDLYLYYNGDGKDYIVDP